ncbi:reo_6 protein [Plakobranchus ocellatus]|uniref:Reo_6 protein n=1 Tax=Plakobranchus ocellatus TaxID=259542 RepID=A0AAV4BWR0_9GAST|nr:reo_6 protein [Plakobranchus ocellatus]
MCPDLYKSAKTELRKCIKDSKRRHREKIRDSFNTRDSKKLWSNLNLITQYKSAKQEAQCDDTTLPDRLNYFYARFDRDNTTTPAPLSCDEDPSFVITEHDVRRSLGKLRDKAAGPDNIKPRLLRNCRSQLASVLCFIFNWSLETSTVPICFKRSTIIPVPKKSSPLNLNDHRPVALTSVLMKCFESFVLKYLHSFLPRDFDPFQFAYRCNRSIEDAIAINYHEILNHLETKKAYARISFIDFSSAFNTIIPQKLYDKLLLELNLPVKLCNWILDFLLNRPQVVKIGKNISSSITLNTGTPQGCPLSPKLYSISTYDCKAVMPGCSVIKFADDTTVTGLILHNDESNFRKQIDLIVNWCSKNNLHLNVDKTKEIIVDFRRGETPPPPLLIHGATVERVPSFKFLGTHVSDKLTWDINLDNIVKKARQRLYFLRKLKSFDVGSDILINFYRATIESVLTLSITVWFGRTSKASLGKLESIIRLAEKIINIKLPSLEEFYIKRLTGKTKKIMKDLTHPAAKYFCVFATRSAPKSL